MSSSMSKHVEWEDVPVPAKIIGVQFSMLSPEEIRKNSVLEITNRETYKNNRPVKSGLFDPRMGVLEPGTICPTDGYTYIDTPGYFGHIELARPVFFIQHLKEILNISRTVCFKCSKLLVNKRHHSHILKMEARDRWEYVFNLAKKIKRCGDATEDGCGCLQPDRIKLEGMATVFAIWEDIAVGRAAAVSAAAASVVAPTNTLLLDPSPSQETVSSSAVAEKEPHKVKIHLTPEIILRIFRRISDEDVTFMGFSPVFGRPDWMICQVLPVPPPAVRPSVKLDAQQRSEDDITQIYSNIIKTNKDLRDKMDANANPNTIDNLTILLQYYVAMIVNNKVKGALPLAQRSGRALQCIMSRLNSKYGRIRGNLMGKRVDFSARSVITGDPNLSIRQLGVPLKIAMNLTKPITTNDRNREFLTQLVRNGPDMYPGANKVWQKRNGVFISLRNVDRTMVRLQNGDIVHRHMIDNDAVLFNRQPSLHRMSMMCHMVKVMKRGDTFRLNVGTTQPYNADFDGDEMNAHLPQNVLAETELRHLAAIPYQIISPSKNAPIIGIFQDSMLGAFQFTSSKRVVGPREAMNLLVSYSNVDPIKLRKKGKGITNFDVLSQILPPMSLTYKTGLFEASEDYATSNNVLRIVNGEYISGQIEKPVLGSGTKGIVHRIFNDFGHMACSNFIDNIQGIVTEYMKKHAYSVGISDLIADNITQQKIIQTINTQKLEVQSIIQQVHLGIFENNTAQTNLAAFEISVNNALKKAMDEAGKFGRETLSKDNRFVRIVKSGSKGNYINISQMISCLGQQNVDGKRIPYGFEHRTLPHFCRYDDSPNARGFIENSFISGLTAPQLFFHAMGGRVGLIDTAVKTSKTGYVQRRLIKGLEDLKVEYDMTVRNSKGKIVQFAYGDDGFDSTKVENQPVPLVGMSLEEIYLHYDMAEAGGIGGASAPGAALEIYTKAAQKRVAKEIGELRDRCKSTVDEMVILRDEIVSGTFRYQDDNVVRVPVSFASIISNVQGQLGLNDHHMVDITPYETFLLLDEYFAKLHFSMTLRPTHLFRALYYFYLSPRELLIKRRFHRKAIILLLETVLLRFKQAIVHPGEMVGVIAGQSIGEPITQLTLQTFYHSGTASKTNVTTGVPRIEELLRLTKNPKNPSMTVFLRSADETDRNRASNCATMMEHTKLVDIVKQIQICFDPLETATCIPEDTVLLQQYYEFEQIVGRCLTDPSNVTRNTVNSGPPRSKWVLRMELNAEAMLEKNITMDDVHFSIKHSAHGNDIQCIYTDYNADNLVFRIRLDSSMFNKDKKRSTAAAAAAVASMAAGGSVCPPSFLKSLDQSDEIYMFKHFQDALLNGIVLRGLSGIANVLPRKLQNTVYKQDGKWAKRDTWVLDTTGSNLLEALGLDYVDYTRTFSNDVREVYNVLGIEAARQVLFNEFNEVMAVSGDVYINYHHLSLLCDRMMATKDMVSIFRSGLLNDNVGPIAKATFEVQTETMLDAARHAEFDHMRGVSACVMTAQFGFFGTHAFDVILDVDKLRDLRALDVSDQQTRETTGIEDELFARATINDAGSDLCSVQNIEIKNNITHIKYHHPIAVAGTAADTNTSTTPGIESEAYNMGF